MTEILSPEKLSQAVKIIKNGGLVAFPTETVYGLGADALSEEAVRKIFLTKQRSFTNPLNINIADASLVEKFATNIEDRFWKIIANFWPGPLTIILPLKKASVPQEVTAGLATVGFRMPQNQLARALIKQVGAMVAPSANLSGGLSPTSFKHVLADLGGVIEAIIACDQNLGGIESTVLDLSSLQPKILRTGAITPKMLTPFLGEIEFAKEQDLVNLGRYATNIPVAMVKWQKNNWQEAISRAQAQGEKIGILADIGVINKFSKEIAKSYVLTKGKNIDLASKNLFTGLRELTQNKNLSIILVQTFPETDASLAYLNRLQNISKNRYF